MFDLFHTLATEITHIGAKEIGVMMAIVVMDAALSGDNSIAINALAMNLPEKQRNKAVWIGMTFAAVFRLVALAFASFIMTNPWVQILGGGYLIKLCVDHFRSEDSEKSHKKHSSFLAVLLAIGLLDLSLSLDNVIAVVAMTDNLAVICGGVLISIAMLAVATKVTQFVMKRYPSLEPAAYVILGFLGVVMLLEHTGEFLIWAWQKLSFAVPEIFHKLHVDVGELWEITGVAIICGTAIFMDERKKRKARSISA